ncbi:MAG: hypothetical protein ACRDPH_05765 [Marmoricola sp.]
MPSIPAPARLLRGVAAGARGLAPRLRPGRRTGRVLAAYAGCVLAAAVVAAPVCVERSVEGVHFGDQLGTFPVQVSMAHNGYSTLDTGVFGTVYLHRTGAWGFGAYARSTGPPEAGGTLASYVAPKFIQANVSMVEDPSKVAHSYAMEMARRFRGNLVREELVAGLAGGAVLFLLLPRRRLRHVPRAGLAMASVGLVVVATAAATGVAFTLFRSWPGSQPPATTYPLPAKPALSFGSPQTQEVAEQVKPFIDKNAERIRERADQYEQRARESFLTALPTHYLDLLPRDHEKIVIAEADPQGSYVGLHLRREIHAALARAVGPDAFAVRTIAGDVTSNGTVSEASYVAQEARVSGATPTVAVGGDHDSTKTWKQMKNHDMVVPDLTTDDVDGILVTGANDREHKTLFGGMVTDRTGVSEEQLGHRLRAAVDKDASRHPGHGRVVLVHQPYAAAAYLGLGSIDQVLQLPRGGDHLTTPYDDGIPDQPPGIVDYGHWHQLGGPWVLWNTDGGPDGDTVTWTVVDQLGTAGGAENVPTFSRFSTPYSAPLKPLTLRLQYVDTRSGLETGYATIRCDLAARCSISRRTDVGLPGGLPRPLDTVNGPSSSPSTPSPSTPSPSAGEPSPSTQAQHLAR